MLVMREFSGSRKKLKKVYKEFQERGLEGIKVKLSNLFNELSKVFMKR